MFVAIVTLILTIMYLVWLNRLIKFGVVTAQRIAVATEDTHLALVSIYDSLPPEAKERAGAALLERKKAKIKAFEDKQKALAVRPWF